MKNISHPKSNILSSTNLLLTLCTMFFIYSFLSGKIIDIPFGTQKGGIISAIGVLVIIVIMFVISVGVRTLIHRTK